MKRSIVENWKRFVVTGYAVAHDRSPSQPAALAGSCPSQPGRRAEAGDLSLFLDWISGFAWLG